MASAVWPPAGIAIASLLRFGGRVSPGIWIGYVLANAGGHAALPAVLVMGTGATGEAVAALWFLRRLVGRTRDLFDSANHAFAFCGSGAAAALISATVGSLCLDCWEHTQVE